MNGKSDGIWYCKYCKKTVGIFRKMAHRMTNRHRIKARWYKYFEEIDRAVAHIRYQLDHGLITIDEFNRMEDEIYLGVDRADMEGYFWNLRDEE